MEIRPGPFPAERIGTHRIVFARFESYETLKHYLSQFG
jgi:hypothetical protein